MRCICFMFLYLHLYIYNFIKKKNKSHFYPFLEQGQGCGCNSGAPGLGAEPVRLQERWWRLAVWGQTFRVGVSADVSRIGAWEVGLAHESLANKFVAPQDLHHPWQ